MSSNEYNCKSDLDKVLKKIYPKFDDNSGSSHKKMAGKLEDYIEELKNKEPEVKVTDSQATLRKVGELEKAVEQYEEDCKQLPALLELEKAVNIICNHAKND